jgi:hypothetical protein
VPTLRELRRGLADRVAPFELAITGIQASDGTASGVALSGNRRRIISTDLVSLDASGTAPEAPSDYLKNDWVYLLSDPPQQRRIPEGSFIGFARADDVAEGYVPPAETECAYFDVERSFADVVPAGLEVEIHGVPPLRGGKSPGLHAQINKALRIQLREDTVGVPGLSGTYRYDVTSLFPWLKLPAQFVDARFPEGTVVADTAAIPGASLRFDADRVLLSPNAAIPTGQTLPIRVLRPLSSWIKPEGASDFAESTVGLVSDGDECLGDLDAITLQAACYVAEALAEACIVGSPEQTFWFARAQTYAQRSPFLRDQRARKHGPARYPWPDLISPDGPAGGRWGPGFR